VTTVAGNGLSGSVDGYGTSASMAALSLISLTSKGQLYFTDRVNYRIRLVDMTGLTCYGRVVRALITF
jgi:hypothetical protein